jgi:hypothetical protein
LAALIVVAIRLLVPLIVFRQVLAGAILSLAADAIDILIFQLLDFSGVWDYHQLDKLLDTYMLALQVIVAQRREALPRIAATGLFAFRAAGVLIFELTESRLVLVFFPNLFDFFFLWYAAVLHFTPEYALTPRRLALWLGMLLVPKMAQEYILHHARLLGELVALDIIKDAARKVAGWLWP